MRVRAMLGAQSFIGTPGNPAPEPRSATRAKPFTAEHPSALLRAGAEGAEEFFSVLPWLAGVGGMWGAAKRDSPKCVERPTAELADDRAAKPVVHEGGFDANVGIGRGSG